MYDIIIVGGGPAGLSAALYALRAGKHVLVLEKNNFGGQIALSPRVDNYPGLPSVSGAALTDALLTQVTDRGGEVDLATVTGLGGEAGARVVRTDGEEYAARAVILCTGARHRRLGLPREEELTGSGVSYCAVCDGAFYEGRPVAVAGGGDAALQDALLLSGICSTVYLIHRRREFRAEAANVAAIRERANIRPVLEAVITGLAGESELKGVEIERAGERKLLPLDGLFVAVGFEAENDAFRDAAALTPDGWFDADETCATRSEGVFVAGDCRRKSVRQLTTAVGDGAVAAVAACRYLDGR